MEFSFARIWLLIKKQIAENTQLYFFGLLAMAGVLLAVLLFCAIHPFGLTISAQGFCFQYGLMIFGSIFTTTLFNQFTDKIKGAQVLVLPASSFEKLVTAIIFSLIIFPLAYIIVGYPVVLLAHFIDVNIAGNFNLLYVFFNFGQGIVLLISFIILQPFVLFCSVLFKRYTIIKTVVFLCVIVYGLEAVDPLIAGNMIKGVYPKTVRVEQRFVDENEVLVKTGHYTSNQRPTYLFAQAYYNIRFTTNDDKFLMVQLPDWQQNLFLLLLFGTVFYLLGMTWLKIKELQV